MDKQYGPYINRFVEVEKVKLNKGWEGLFLRLKKYEKFIADWDRTDLDKFIFSLQSISVNTINRYLQFIRKFYNFVCKQDKQTPKKLYLTYDLKKYIDFNKLMSITIDTNRYKMLRELLIIPTSKGNLNYRDKVIVELAWHGLSNHEIKNLKIKDIEFINNAINKNHTIVLHTKKRDIKINELETINDIKIAISQDEYYIYPTESRKEQFRKLKFTPYLIRPVDTRDSKKLTATNPSQLFKNALIRSEASIPDIDIYSLSLEDIRRSHTIEMLKDPEVTLDDIKKFTGKKSDSDLYWLQELAYKIDRVEQTME